MGENTRKMTKKGNSKRQICETNDIILYGTKVWINGVCR